MNDIQKIGRVSSTRTLLTSLLSVIYNFYYAFMNIIITPIFIVMHAYLGTLYAVERYVVI